MLQEALSHIGVHLSSPSDLTDLFEWASMNCATRCFGHPHVPNEIAMVPLLDLVNHSQDQSVLRFFLAPASLHVQMLDVEIDR